MNFRIALASDRFTYYADEKCFTSEASDLEGKHLQRLYEDSHQIGFVMQSSRTGVQVEYVLVREHKDADHDVTFWEYRPSWVSESDVPAAAGSVVKIFND